MSLFFITGHSFKYVESHPLEVVIDIGANVGEFGSSLVNKTSHPRILIGVEPNADLLSNSANSNFYTQIINKAILNHADGVYFEHCTANSEASTICDDESKLSSAANFIPSITFEDIVSHYDSIDLVKVDCEGAEKYIFLDSSDEALIKVRQFTVEFHCFTNPPLLSDSERIAIYTRLKKLGFKAIKVSLSTHGNVLFLNSKYIHFTFLEYLEARFFHMLKPGVLRRFQ